MLKRLDVEKVKKFSEILGRQKRLSVGYYDGISCPKYVFVRRVSQLFDNKWIVFSYWKEGRRITHIGLFYRIEYVLGWNEQIYVILLNLEDSKKITLSVPHDIESIRYRLLTSQEVETIYGLYEDDIERDKRLRMHNQTAKRVKLFLQKNGLDFGWSDKTIKTFVSASKDNPLYFNHETGNIEGFIAPDNSALLNEYEIIDIE